MPSWNDLFTEFNSVAVNQKTSWFQTKFKEEINKISKLRNRSVIIYSSAFLQKTPVHTLISKEDINAFMSIIKGWIAPRA